jgi:hypothetical protein
MKNNNNKLVHHPPSSVRIKSNINKRPIQGVKYVNKSNTDTINNDINNNINNDINNNINNNINNSWKDMKTKQHELDVMLRLLDKSTDIEVIKREDLSKKPNKALLVELEQTGMPIQEELGYITNDLSLLNSHFNEILNDEVYSDKLIETEDELLDIDLDKVNTLIPDFRHNGLSRAIQLEKQLRYMRIYQEEIFKEKIKKIEQESGRDIVIQMLFNTENQFNILNRDIIIIKELYENKISNKNYNILENYTKYYEETFQKIWTNCLLNFNDLISIFETYKESSIKMESDLNKIKSIIDPDLIELIYIINPQFLKNIETSILSNIDIIISDQEILKNKKLEYNNLQENCRLSELKISQQRKVIEEIYKGDENKNLQRLINTCNVTEIDIENNINQILELEQQIKVYYGDDFDINSEDGLHLEKSLKQNKINKEIFLKKKDDKIKYKNELIEEKKLKAIKLEESKVITKVIEDNQLRIIDLCYEIITKEEKNNQLDKKKNKKKNNQNKHILDIFPAPVFTHLPFKNISNNNNNYEKDMDINLKGILNSFVQYDYSNDYGLKDAVAQLNILEKKLIVEKKLDVDVDEFRARIQELKLQIKRVKTLTISQEKKEKHSKKIYKDSLKKMNETLLLFLDSIGDNRLIYENESRELYNRNLKLSIELESLLESIVFKKKDIVILEENLLQGGY